MSKKQHSREAEVKRAERLRKARQQRQLGIKSRALYKPGRQPIEITVQRQGIKGIKNVVATQFLKTMHNKL
jgi:hypothetical protein